MSLSERETIRARLVRINAMGGLGYEAHDVIRDTIAHLDAEGAQTRTDVEPMALPYTIRRLLETLSEAHFSGDVCRVERNPLHDGGAYLEEVRFREMSPGDGEGFAELLRALAKDADAILDNHAPYPPPTDAPGMSREAVEKVLADYFGLRPYAEMAADRADLRGKIRDGYDVNEPTKSDLADAADAILALASLGGEQEAVRGVDLDAIYGAAMGVLRDIANDMPGVRAVHKRTVMRERARQVLKGYASPVRGAGEELPEHAHNAGMQAIRKSLEMHDGEVHIRGDAPDRVYEAIVSGLALSVGGGKEENGLSQSQPCGDAQERSNQPQHSDGEG